MKLLQATKTRAEGVRIGKLAGATWIRWRAPHETDQEFLEGVIQMARSFARSQVKLAKSNQGVPA